VSKRNDISQQIQKYLNGELDARAMQQLEHEALNDPFLAEALEGYEQSASDQQANLADINARLQQRINAPGRRVISWRFIAIAASVLIAFTIGGLLVFNHQPEKITNNIARLNRIKTAQPAGKPALPAHADTLKPAPGIAATEIAAVVQKAKRKTNTPTTAEIAYAPPKADDLAMNTAKSGAAVMKTSPVIASAPMQRDTVPLNEVVVIGYAAQRKTSITASVTAVKPATLNKDANGVSNELQGKVAGISLSKIRIRTVTGVVNDNGEPIPGATVRLKGTDIVTQTDMNGRFRLPAVPDKAVLDIAFIGYQTKELKLRKTDSLVIAMVPNTNSLNEVVVTGYGVKKEDSDDQDARPAGGWTELRKYLKDNAHSPDGKTGVVKLSFMINADNSLSGFKIIKSLSAKTDTAAIQLVQDGPRWLKSIGSQPEKVKLHIKFTTKNKSD